MNNELQEITEVIPAGAEIAPKREVNGLSASTQSKIQKLIRSKSVQREGTDQIVVNNTTINEIDLPEILSGDDCDFYVAKKATYLDKWPELLEDPFDMDALHNMIMEQIRQRNLWRKKKKHPNVDIETQLERSLKRQENFTKQLSMRRTDRLKSKEKKQTINIAELSLSFLDKDKMDEMEQKLANARLEEESLRGSGKVTE